MKIVDASVDESTCVVVAGNMKKKSTLIDELLNVCR